MILLPTSGRNSLNNKLRNSGQKWSLMEIRKMLRTYIIIDIILMIVWAITLGFMLESNKKLRHEVKGLQEQYSALQASSQEFDSTAYKVMEETVGELQRHSEVFDGNVDVLNERFDDIDRRINAIVNYLR